MADEDFKPSRAQGDRIGNYVIVRIIGRGGLSEVYLAKNVVNEKRLVAIKVLARRFQNRSDLRKRLEREAGIYDALDHDNIVRMHDIGLLDDGAVYIVMDLVRGRTLREHLALGELDLTGVLHIMVLVTSAMCFAHRKGVFHRDLKPENIMVTPDAKVKVLDFGIAKFAQGGDDSSEMPKLGTLAFLAPENFCKKPVDGRADIYALGVIIYILFTGGKHPFENDDGDTSDAEMIGRHLHAVPRPLHEFVSKCSVSASFMVSKCLAKDPEDRYATMDELLEAMDAVINESIPPNHPIAQRAREEQELARASGVQFPARSEATAQRVTEPLVHFTPPPPESILPFNRDALPPPPPPAPGKGHTESVPPTPAAAATPWSSEHVATPPGATAMASAVGLTVVPGDPAATAPPDPPVSSSASTAPAPAALVSPSAPAAPAAPSVSSDASTASAPPAPIQVGFAPARTELTPSSSEANGQGRTNKRSESMQHNAMNVRSPSLSNRAIVLMGLAAGATVAAMVATLPGFQEAVRAKPHHSEARAAAAPATVLAGMVPPSEPAPEVPGSGANMGAASAGPAPTAEPLASVVPPVTAGDSSSLPEPSATTQPAAAAPTLPPTQPAAPAPAPPPTQTPPPAPTTPPPPAARSTRSLPTAKPKAPPPPAPAALKPPPTAEPAVPPPPPATTAPHRIFGSEG
jgi:serine/threonine-protein kinase